MIATLAGAAVPSAAAAANPYERGPAPTRQSVEAPRGPFATKTIAVPAGSVPGVAAGTIYYPTDTSQGTFGAVAIAPGFTEGQWAISWYGERLASQGFVVYTIDTLTPLDFPDARADQLLAALDYLTKSSAVKDRVDATRLGVMGHSMGGGGSLSASLKRPQLQAAIPLAPWHLTQDWSSDQVPTLIIGAESDFIAPVGAHAEPFYGKLPASLDKAYLEMKGADHFVTNSPNTVIAKFAISWLKRFIDNDTRYEQFLCPPPKPDNTISEYRDTCPHSS
ncbi:alpha/beta fold hydrolase [Amycolatopsis anabasis]|uniref:poly(ethylene terephthalate) hydrolase family protein n=1 Tax=Amycolatopsis anabasis TaxID=1840409 RepID=UPI00131D1C2A|nr:alpha/beta hydrolase [Amycolatopsis anabasis]